MEPKLIAVLGPTASGKSALAVAIAKKYNGEIISADSRQVYCNLNIGTGKITHKEMRGIPHHLLDVANPKKIFTVDDFQKKTTVVINGIQKRGKNVVLCGGTGFYIHAITDNLSIPNVPPNQKLRRKLERRSARVLFEQLQKIDPKRARTIDRDNSRRLIRAIEIVLALGSVPTIQKNPLYNTLQIGIKTDPEILKRKIHNRLIARLKKGMIAEAVKLHKSGLSWKRMENLGLEYRYLARFLQKKITKQELITQLEKEIWQYAKRQITWFRKDKRIVWFEIGHKKEIFNTIKKFLKLNLGSGKRLRLGYKKGDLSGRLNQNDIRVRHAI